MATRGRGCISHVPRKVPRLGPTELHYRLISSALRARHSIAILGSDYRILSADIPKTMQRVGFQAGKTAFSPAATKKIRNEMNSRKPTAVVVGYFSLFFFLFSLQKTSPPFRYNTELDILSYPSLPLLSPALCRYYST